MHRVPPTLESEVKSMSPAPNVIYRPGQCELRFQSLYDAGRYYAFPCDAAGNVDMDALSDRARTNYLYARTAIGREFSHPAVMISAAH